MELLTKKLHENWKMRKVGDAQWIPATVPGSVYADLMAAGIMEDPFWKDNEDEALNRMEFDYEYQTVFDASAEFLSRTCFLKAEGLDTIADIFLNGEPIASTENMHRTYEFVVSDLLKASGNVLTIIFRSPLKFIRDAYEKCRADGSGDAMVGFAHIRKAHCMFGWDWGPRLPDAGIWRDLTLIGVKTARINEVFIEQEHIDGKVVLSFQVGSQSFVTESELSYDIEILAPTGEKALFTNSLQYVAIDDPVLWWPNGLGEQNLYEVTVTLRAGDTVLDCWSKRIGLRTLTIRQEKDEWGESFAHEVNGVAFFAMGADYIPEDNILARVNEQRTRELLNHCVTANFNTIRVWGGGYYPDDYFYDICDELGLVVWQDFMFACAVYELSDAFEENIKQEVIDNIKRLRHHASLGLWCGNNEMEMFVDRGLWVSSKKQKADYTKMYEYIFPKLVKRYNPQTFYWPASPSSGGAFDEPNGESKGDAHYWEVWHGEKPFVDYRKHFYRYLSEFGFQSFPSEKTIDTFTDDERDKNIFSYIMEKHQRNNAANGKLVNYLSQTYLYPNRFDILLYATQLLQADAIRCGVEHFRRNRGRCMGTVYWQLNDCWPVASWSSIDSTGRYKALQYKARHFFAPLLLSCEEEGLHTQDINVNAERKDIKQSVRFNVSNEGKTARAVTVRWAICDVTGKQLEAFAKALTVEPFQAVWLEKVELPQLDRNRQYVSYELWEEDQLISDGAVLFTAPKFFRFADPKLSYRVEGQEIIISAEQFAKSVAIENENDDLLLSDNFFDMNQGEKRVRVLKGEIKEIKLKSVYDIR